MSSSKAVPAQAGTGAPEVTSSSLVRGRPLAPSRASAQATISEQMVAAGVEVLWQSGAIEAPQGSEGLLVSEIFQAMANLVANKLLFFFPSYWI